MYYYNRARPNYSKIERCNACDQEIKKSTNNPKCCRYMILDSISDREMSDKITEELDIEITTQFLLTDKILDRSFRIK